MEKIMAKVDDLIKDLDEDEATDKKAAKAATDAKAKAAADAKADAKAADAGGAAGGAVEALDMPTDGVDPADAKADLAEADQDAKDALARANEASAMESSAKADDDAKVQAEAKRASPDIIAAAEEVADEKRADAGQGARRGSPRVTGDEPNHPAKGQEPDPEVGVSRQTRAEMAVGHGRIKDRN